MSDVIKANISDLMPDPRNANKGTRRGRGMLDQSLRQYGAGRSILLDKHNRIIAGNKTTEAAADIGLNDVVIVESDGTKLIAVKRTDLDLNDSAARELAYADNRVAQIDLDWDATQMLQDAAAGVDLDKFFLKDELDEMLGRAIAGDADAEPQIDRAAELNEKWQVKRGDLWRIGEHRLLCGDSTRREDVERLLNGAKVFAFSDPPYGIDVVQATKVGGGGATHFGKVGGGNWVNSHEYPEIIGDDSTDTARAFYSLCVEFGVKDYILWGGNYFTDFLPPSRCWLVWDKKNTGNFADVELAWTSFDKSAKKYEWLWNGLSREGNRRDELESRIHPTQKPVGLTVKIMTDFDAPIYFDGFVGSGSFMVAAENVHRKLYGIEKGEAWCAVILDRMQQAFGITGVLIE